MLNKYPLYFKAILGYCDVTEFDLLWFASRGNVNGMGTVIRMLRSRISMRVLQH